MKRAALLSFGLLVWAASVTHAQTWELDWSDEFGYEGLPDPAKWSYDVGGGGWGNGELQYYSQDRTDNARVDGEYLIIEARKEPGFGRDYTSARLVSKGKGDWKYGRVEVRAKLPAGRGTWPAIWMLPTDSDHGNQGWPDTGEIDIMEHVGHDPNTVHATVHTDKYNHLSGTQKGGQIHVANFDQEFHTYAADWTPRIIEFSVDGTVFFRFRNDGRGWGYWPFDRPFHLVMNIAIGGSWGGQQGVDDSIFPQQMVVDYVRVYRNTGIPDISLTAPSSTQPGGQITLTAEASDSDGDLAYVRLLQGDGVLGSLDAAYYELMVEDAQPGCYLLSAEAVDAGGWYRKSESVEFKVGDSCVQAPYLIAPHAIPGSIEAEHFDLGGRGTAYGDVTSGNEGGSIRADEGVDIEGFAEADEQGYAVVSIQRREWLEYTVRVRQSGSHTLEARVASTGPKVVMDLEVNDVVVVEGLEHQTRSLTAKWEVVRQSGVMLEEGLHTLRVRMQSSDFMLDRLQFAFDSPTSTQPDQEDGLGALLINHPNPFAGETRLIYHVPTRGHAKLDVYNAIGQHVATLIDGPHARGTHHTIFSSYDLPSGVYYSRLRSAGNVQTRTMTVVRD